MVSPPQTFFARSQAIIHNKGVGGGCLLVAGDIDPCWCRGRSLRHSFVDRSVTHVSDKSCWVCVQAPHEEYQGIISLGLLSLLWCWSIRKERCLAQRLYVRRPGL